MTTAVIILSVILGLFVIAEVGLRQFLGFGNPLVYIADEQIGYLLAPNQSVRRFGNRIAINQYSMRSAPVAMPKPGNTFRVLLLGDSIANGGWWTDQEDTVSAILQRQLRTVIPIASFETIEVLNASANSWGPRNELAYLKRFGHFEAQAIVLLINTDDLFATAPTSLPVGRDRNYPARKPPLALAELLNRYLLKSASVMQPPQEDGDRVGFNLQAIQQIQAIAQDNQVQMLLAMTPLLRELGEPGPRDYERKARDRLHEFAQQETIPFIDFLPHFNAAKEFKSLYHDHIHLSPEGNQKISQQIAKELTSP